MGNSLYSRVRGDDSESKVIILHGLFGSSDNLGSIAASLSEHFQTHALDLRNHGRSIQSTEMNYALMAEDILQYIQSLELNDKVSVIGHSMGGKVAMKLALTYPDIVDKLIVADISPVEYPPHHDQILKGLSSLQGKIFSSRKEADELLAQYVEERGVRQFLLKNLSYGDNRELTLKLNVESIKNNYKNIMSGQYQPELSFDGDVLFIAGGLSDYIKTEHKEMTLSLFPKAQLKVIPDTSHWLHAEKPELFSKICERFLR